MSLKGTVGFIPKKRRNKDLNVKVVDVLDFILEGAFKDLNDTEFKFRGPEVLDEDAIRKILEELGFGYIGDLLDASQEIDENAVLAFITLVSFLKGHRDGFELVLDLLGFSVTDLTEWWERDPKGEPWTFQLTIDINGSNVTEFFETFVKFKRFVREYVFPIIEPLTFVATSDPLNRNVPTAGFIEKIFEFQTPAILITNLAGAAFASAVGTASEP